MFLWILNSEGEGLEWLFWKGRLFSYCIFCEADIRMNTYELSHILSTLLSSSYLNRSWLSLWDLIHDIMKEIMGIFSENKSCPEGRKKKEV